MITPVSGILLIKKHKKGQFKADIAVEETDENKNLITGEVIAGNEVDYPVGTTVIFGKYSLFLLVLQGEKFYFLDAEDVIGTCSYKE